MCERCLKKISPGDRLHLSWKKEFNYKFPSDQFTALIIEKSYYYYPYCDCEFIIATNYYKIANELSICGYSASLCEKIKSLGFHYSLVFQPKYFNIYKIIKNVKTT